MAYQFILTAQAEADLEDLDPQLAFKIRKKIRYFHKAENPMTFAKPLINLPPATHRFRFGDIRIKFFRQGNIFYITGVDFRDCVYQ